MTTQRTTGHNRALQPLSIAARNGAHAAKRGGRPACGLNVLPRPTPHLSANQYVRLLALIDDAGGVVTIDQISRAMPRVSQPVSAVFDLCDARVLNVDWEATFDGDMHVWRVDR